MSLFALPAKTSGLARYTGTWSFVYNSMNALKHLITPMLLVGVIMTAGSARAQDPCPNGNLPVGNGGPLVINKVCHVALGGLYSFGDVNIVNNGSLVFDEVVVNQSNKTTNFW